MDLSGILTAGLGVGALIVGGVILVVLAIVAFIFFRLWYRVPKADEALVVVGKKQKGAEGGAASSMAVITGGGTFVNKITQRCEAISLRARQIKFDTTAQTKNGVTIDLAAVALVKVGSNPVYVRRAAERFATQDKAIDLFTTEQLEGALRGVVAKLSVEEVMQDRQKLSDQIAEGIKNDLEEQGLILDSFAIQGITDRNGYIEALGATEVERVRREAEVARINAAREVKARQLATDEQNLVEQTAYDKNSAAASAEVGRARAEAQQAEALARAEREQAVLLQQAENKQATLDAEVKKVADARKYEQQSNADASAYAAQKDAEAKRVIAQQQADAEAYRVKAEADARQAAAAAEAEAIRVRAEAEAAAIAATGQAKAEAIKAEAEALKENQDAILARELIGVLPTLMGEFAKGYANVGSVTLVGGDSAGTHMAREQSESLAATFGSVKAATGVDLSRILDGQALGRGIAAGATVTEADIDLGDVKFA